MGIKGEGKNVKEKERREGGEQEEEEKRRKKKEGERKEKRYGNYDFGMEFYGFLWFGMTISLFQT